MKIILSIFIYLISINMVSAQLDTVDFQSDPKLLLEEVFRAADKQDYSNLYKLCPPNKSNDGDTQKYICDVASSSEKVINEFTKFFKNGRITGEPGYSLSSEGAEIAKVEFWFKNPGGKSRRNEIMNMVKIDDKWYLLSF